MQEHLVQQGDCITSIAAAHGVSAGTLWNLPENAELKRRRKNPNVLLPGDVVRVPERERRDEAGATTLRHRFVKRTGNAKLRVRLLLGGEPRRGVPCRLYIDGAWSEGTTDRRGIFEKDISAEARSARLMVSGEGYDDVYEFSLGCLDPIDTESGLRGRLANLGFPAKEDIAEGLRAFQLRHGLDATGNADDATREKLQSEFGL